MLVDFDVFGASLPDSDGVAPFRHIFKRGFVTRPRNQ
jgi:hypothetical protein